MTPEEFVSRGLEIYTARLKDLLEPEHAGKYVAIEVETGDYFVGVTRLAAAERAKAAHPERMFYFIKIGSLRIEITRRSYRPEAREVFEREGTPIPEDLREE